MRKYLEKWPLIRLNMLEDTIKINLGKVGSVEGR
jgi:hypothetical protein